MPLKFLALTSEILRCADLRSGVQNYLRIQLFEALLSARSPRCSTEHRKQRQRHQGINHRQPGQNSPINPEVKRVRHSYATKSFEIDQ